MGHGVYVQTTLHAAREAFALFGVELGVASRDDLLAQIDARRSKPGGLNPVIATVLLKDPVVFPSARPFELPWPLDDADTTVPLCTSRSKRGKGLLLGLHHHARPHSAVEEALQSRLLDGGRGRRHSPPRRAWSTLRSMTMRLYAHRCALTGERVSAVHDVIHLRPREKGGADALGNLMALRTDCHRLVEHKLLAFDEDHRAMISGQLGLFEDSTYLGLDGRQLRRRLFGPPWPDDASLHWLRDRFKGPRYRP